MKRRNGIKVGVKSNESKPKKANKMPFQIRLRPDLKEFIDALQSDGSFKTQTAVVEGALEFLRHYMTDQKKMYAKYGLHPYYASGLPVSPSASPSDSA